MGRSKGAACRAGFLDGSAQRLLSIALIAGISTGLASCSGKNEAGRRINVLLISLDSTRADHLSCYGRKTATGEPTSPTLDRLAGEGVRFANVVSTTSWTMPSHTALLCGLPDLLHGAVDDFHSATPDRRPLPVLLRDAGYATAGFWSGPYLDPVYGFGEGFETGCYENASGIETLFDRIRNGQGTEVAAQPAALQEELFHDARTAERVTRRAREWLAKEANGARPFFLFVHYFDVHYDYVPETSYAKRFWPGGRRPRLDGERFLENPEIHPGMDPADLAGVETWYDGEIRWVDEEVGRLLEELDESGVADDTLVCIVGDHGDAFFEHGVKGHRNDLYEETLRVPWIMRLPGRLPAGTSIVQRVSIVDVTPTLLDLVGVLPDPAPLERGRRGGLVDGFYGRSARPLIDGRERDDREAVGYLFDTRDKQHLANLWCLWTGPFKVIVKATWTTESQRHEASTVTGEVYDLVRDPGEKVNLAADRSKLAPDVEAAIARYDEHLCSQLFPLAGRLRAGPLVAASEAERAKIIAEVSQLGYVAPQWVSEQPAPRPFPRASR